METVPARLEIQALSRLFSGFGAKRTGVIIDRTGLDRFYGLGPDYFRPVSACSGNSKGRSEHGSDEAPRARCTLDPAPVVAARLDRGAALRSAFAVAIDRRKARRLG